MIGNFEMFDTFGKAVGRPDSFEKSDRLDYFEKVDRLDYFAKIDRLYYF